MWNPLGPAGGDDVGWKPFVDGLLAAERTYGIETEIVDLFPRRPLRGGYEPGSPEDVHRLSERLKAGDFDLVLWPQGLTGPNFYAVVPENPDTRFAFLDFCCVRDVIPHSQTTTTITLRADQAAHLAFGLADDAVALVSISPQVPLSIRRKVAQEAALLRTKDEVSGSS